MPNSPRNRLSEEKSAYLKQHEDNPVHWWAWGPEALEEARKLNRPIFLSIGYSSCHWCHVMAHESFESEEVAALLNRDFICIKVDREEYPDLDAHYQQACQFYTRSGGWPLSAFLLPDLRPFFVGTYFPPVSRPGLSSFTEVLTELGRAFKEERPMLEKNAEMVTENIAKGVVVKEKIQFPGHFPAPSSIANALKDYQDNDHGGHGEAPKFPHFSYNEWAVEQMLEGMIPPELGEHTVKTLENMLFGGIYDHARGGIHRYATDSAWMIPHFEKMLYDQAGLLKVLSKFSLLYAAPSVLDALNDTLDYLQAEMLGEDGVFFSAQDADSEGVEGLFFGYTLEEFEDVLNRSGDQALEENKDKLVKWFQLTKEGNFEHGMNVLSLDLKAREELYKKEGWDLVRKARKAILQNRRDRIPPMTDSKGVASWNFLMLAGLLDTIQYGKVPAIKEKAWHLFNRSMEGAYKAFIQSDGEPGSSARLRHVTTQEKTLPYFEDYALFAQVQLRSYELTGNRVFRDNFIETMRLIQTDFIQGDKVYTRALSMVGEAPQANGLVSAFDSSFCSPLSTYILLVHRHAALIQDSTPIDAHHALIDRVTQEVLRNPLGAGEGLRALTYPRQAYRVVKVPAEWIQNGDFRAFMTYFMPRFVFDYQTGAGQEWQICSLTACELQGQGLESLKEALVPKQPKGNA